MRTASDLGLPTALLTNLDALGILDPSTSAAVKKTPATENPDFRTPGLAELKKSLTSHVGPEDEKSPQRSQNKPVTRRSSSANELNPTLAELVEAITTLPHEWSMVPLEPEQKFPTVGQGTTEGMERAKEYERMERENRRRLTNPNLYDIKVAEMSMLSHAMDPAGVGSISGFGVLAGLAAGKQPEEAR